MRARFALLPLVAGLFLLTSTVAAEVSDIYALFGDPDGTSIGNSGQTIFPTLLIPSGGEYEGMATAYTAVARDVGFLDANPAGSATLALTQLTLTHNNWIEETYVDAVTYTVRMGDLGIGVGGKFLHVPFTHYGAVGDDLGSMQFFEGTVGANVSYNFFRDFYYPGMSVGATIKTAYRYISPAIAQDQSALGIAADLGVLTRLNFLKTFASRSPNFSAGLTLKNFGPAVRGEALPSQITTGISYSPIRPLLIAMDFIVPVNLVSGVSSERVAGAIGAAFQITPFFSAQTGLLLRFTGSRFTLGAALELPDVTIVTNYTLDLLSQWSNLDRFSVQAQLNFGDRGRGERQDAVDALYLDAWLASVAGEPERTVRLLQEALAMDPTFIPAQELLELTQRTLDLQEELRAIDLEGLGDTAQ